MGLDVREPRMLELLDAECELQQLGSGFSFTEGPVWVAGEDYLLFADVPAQLRLRWDARHGVRRVAVETSMSNGMTLDAAGRLVVCEGETGSIVRMDSSGTGAGRRVLACRHHGSRLNSPNDVVVHSSGAIYFTDPWWPQMLGSPVARELDFQGVYRLLDGGEPELMVAGMEFPNGLCFSPGERALYVNDSASGRIRVFDVRSDGSLDAGRVLADGVRDGTGHVDGMKCDADGNIWVTGPGGVWVLDAAGSLLGVLATPARAGNLHWGGPGWSWLFITASDGLYRVVTRTAGAREPFMCRATGAGP